MALHRILLFDTITDGHHPDYLIHLIGFYSGNQEVELFVATGESFKSQFDARQKDENNQWGDNVTFLGIPTDKLNSIHSKPIYLRSIIEWNMLVETAKEINASQVLLMYFDYYQLGILIGKKVWLPEAEFQLLVDKSSPLSLLGYMVVEKGIELGKIEEVIEQPHQLMVTILYQGQEAYIPLHEESLKGVDHAKKQVDVVLPDGLLDLYTETDQAE